MANSKIMLINAPLPAGRSHAGNYAAFAALGPASLATRLLKHHKDLDVKVVDGGVSDFEEIKREIESFRPQIVGIGVLTPTYSEGLRIAQHAKEDGALVILGNDHASIFGELILHNQPFVDYVVRAEFGEDPFLRIVERELYGKPLDGDEMGREQIYFREGEVIRKISFPKRRLQETYHDERDMPDLSLIKDALERAKDNYNQRYRKRHGSEMTPAIINNVRGCGNGKNRCLYCGLYDLEPNFGSPLFFWRMVEHYATKFRVNFFMEACDSFLSFRRYIKQLIDTRPFDPKERGIEFEVYARADDIVRIDESISWLKSLNITRVNMGLDSGDNDMLMSLRKNLRSQSSSGADINYEAVKRLAEAGITIHASFPLGALGESSASLENTLRFIEKIARDFGHAIATLEASELIPLPNSPSWDILLSEHTLRQKHAGKDILDIIELARDWVEHFTHVSWAEIEGAKGKVDEIAQKIGSIYGRAF